MVLVTECDYCHSRYRVKRTLLDGAFAIRFRCRTCGGYIVVRNPEKRKIAAVPSPTPAPSSASLEIPAAPPAALHEPEMPAIASKAASAASVDLRAIRVEDLVPYSPEEEARAERDIISGMVAVEPVATATRSTTFRRRGWAIAILSFFAGIGIIFLVSGAYYSWGSNPEGKSPGKKSSFPVSASAATAPLKPAYEVQNLESYTPREAIAGKLFVITGTVKNVGKAASRGIRVRATLFGVNNKVLIKQASIAGNYIDKNSLPHMMRTTIEGHLAAARYEEGSGNHNIPPGNSVPFTVVCFEPPSKVESFEVLAMDAEL